MTMTFDEGKPSLEELKHFGKKGMKWGHRKKYSTSQIQDARARQGSRVADANNTAHKLNLATGKRKDALAKTYVQKVNKINSNPDASVAARMTRGEKTAAILLTGPIGLIIVGANSHAVKKMEQKKK